MTIHPAKKPKPRSSGASRGMKRSRLPNRNSKRMAKRLITDFGGAGYKAWISAMPCAICGIHGLSDPAHVKSRGSGGKADKLVPLCRWWQSPFSSPPYMGCHKRFDEFRWTLPDDTEKILTVRAAELYAEYHSNRNPE
jgi:hypothetical protein